MHSGRRFRFLGSVIIACAATMTASQAATQRAPDYPVRPPAPPEQVAHGQQVFRSNCSFCHGSDARGGETGPNLVRAQLVLADQQGELITPIVQNGLPAQGMPKFSLSAADIAAIAAWLHSQPLSEGLSIASPSVRRQVPHFGCTAWFRCVRSSTIAQDSPDAFSETLSVPRQCDHRMCRNNDCFAGCGAACSGLSGASSCCARTGRARPAALQEQLQLLPRLGRQGRRDGTEPGS